MSLQELTAGEKQYMESGGLDVAALLAENPPAAPAADPIVPAAPAAPAAPAIDPAAAAPAAPAVPAAEPAEPGEEEIAAPDGKTKRRVVDSRALKAEREARKAAEAELTRYRENYTRVDERLKMLSEAVSQPDPATVAPAPEEDAEIDPEQDVIAAVKQIGKTLKNIQTQTTDMRAQTDAERQTASLVSTYRQDSATFRQQTPDFMDAYNFLLAKREAQLKALGYGDNDIRVTLYNEEMNLASRALNMGQSPSQQIYALSQSMGYTKAAPVAPAASPAAAGAPAAPAAPAAPQAPSVTAEIDRIKAGQATSRSLSSGGGAAGEELSLEALANMPDKEFAKFMAIPGNREKVEMALGRRAA